MELKSIAKNGIKAYKEGEGLLELGDLFFGEGIGLFVDRVSVVFCFVCLLRSWRAPLRRRRGVSFGETEGDG